VPDVRGLVRIDVGVLDDHARAGRLRRLHHRLHVRRRERAAIEAEVEVARALHGHGGYEQRQLEPVGQRFRDLARLALQHLRQLERERRGEIAHVQFRRRLQDHPLDGMGEKGEHAAAQRVGELLNDLFEDHDLYRSITSAPAARRDFRRG